MPKNPEASDEKQGGPVFSETLACYVISVYYNFFAQRGNLYLLENNVPDMSGCLQLFRSIDPNVKDIDVFSGDELDTVYTKYHGQWISLIWSRDRWIAWCPTFSNKPPDGWRLPERLRHLTRKAGS